MSCRRTQCTRCYRVSLRGMVSLASSICPSITLTHTHMSSPSVSLPSSAHLNLSRCRILRTIQHVLTREGGRRTEELRPESSGGRDTETNASVMSQQYDPGDILGPMSRPRLLCLACVSYWLQSWFLYQIPFIEIRLVLIYCSWLAGTYHSPPPRA